MDNFKHEYHGLKVSATDYKIDFLPEANKLKTQKELFFKIFFLEKRYINNDPTQYTPALIIELNPILILDMTLYIENAENPDCNNLQLKPHCKENDLALLVGHGISLIDDHIKTKKITDINGNLIVTPFPLFQYYNFYNDPFGTPPERAGEEIIY